MELEARDRLERAELLMRDANPSGVMQNLLCSVAMSLTVIAEVMLKQDEEIENLREHASTEEAGRSMTDDLPDLDETGTPEQEEMIDEEESEDEDDTGEED